jgi:methionine-rich copper-binding protein CopC
MIRIPLRPRGRFAALLAVTVLLAMPAVAVAHAEFVSSTPADGDVVEGSPPTVTAVFTEALADGSVMRIRNGAGEVVGEGRVDAANPERMVIEPDALGPGEYSVQWRALAADRHQELGTFSFTVTAAAATLVPTASPTPAASAAGTPSEPPSQPPSPSVAPAPSPAATETPSDAAAGSGDALIPILAAVVLVALLGGYLLLRRRPTARP